MRQYIHGKNVVERRLQEGKEIQCLFLVKNSNKELERLARKKSVPIRYCSKNEMDQMVDAQHQNVIAEIAFYQTYDLKSIISDKENPLIVMLDGISDPHNFGAILRTCAAVGVDGVVIRKDRAAPLNATVARASAGAIDVVKVVPVTNLSRTIDELKELGYWVVGSALEKSQDYRTIDYKGPIVLVVGSEGEGLSRLVASKCDFIAEIPMQAMQSLNVSVASAVLLYEIFNQRNPL